MKSVKLTFAVVLVASIVLSACAAVDPTAAPTREAPTTVEHGDHAERLAVLDQLADRLEMAYLFPEEGSRYASHLRSRGLSAEEAAMPASDFAERITRELQAIHADGHLRLEVLDVEAGNGGPDGPPSPPPSSNWATHHAGGVSYMRLDAMFGLDETIAQIDAFAASASDSETIIIDLRQNRGGGLREMDALFADLFAEPTDLVVMEIREVIFANEGSPFGSPTSLQRIDAPEGLVHNVHRAIPAANPRLADCEVYVLTSPVTGSAAEHLTMALQRTGRATVIGERSRGAAHFGGLIPVGDNFAAFIPAGRTFDPDTGESWEGGGNQPDIETDALSALVLALSLAGLDQAEAEAFRSALE